MKNRGRVEIATVILRNILESGSLGKTQIMYKAYLSYSQTHEYLRMLEQSGLISTRGDKYYVTPKGVGFIDTAQHLLSALKSGPTIVRASSRMQMTATN